MVRPTSGPVFSRRPEHRAIVESRGGGQLRSGDFEHGGDDAVEIGFARGDDAIHADHMRTGSEQALFHRQGSDGQAIQRGVEMLELGQHGFAQDKLIRDDRNLRGAGGEGTLNRCGLIAAGAGELREQDGDIAGDGAERVVLRDVALPASGGELGAKHFREGELVGAHDTVSAHEGIERGEESIVRARVERAQRRQGELEKRQPDRLINARNRNVGVARRVGERFARMLRDESELAFARGEFTIEQKSVGERHSRLDATSSRAKRLGYGGEETASPGKMFIGERSRSRDDGSRSEGDGGGASGTRGRRGRARRE